MAKDYVDIRSVLEVELRGLAGVRCSLNTKTDLTGFGTRDSRTPKRGNRTFVLDVENRDLPTKVVAPKNHMCWVGSLAGRAFGEHNLFNR
jgi:hypothetical protein